MRFFKVLVIILLVLIAAVFLAAGLGADIPQLEYSSAKAYGVPVGVVFLIAAVLIAKFWDVTVSTTHTIEKETTDGGVITKIKDTVSTIKKLSVPPN
jgi:hypothetical protein